ncbi:unnamed protein product [Paramecium pentaurelia]|uniref:Uncharacterized protein n=1 Tax=Paramecium pentaurelia TaxID=43138 RepID=A0A8S1V2C6_9CILI|nr:unnamed protein product [Paramecium pentaurelia]
MLQVFGLKYTQLFEINQLPFVCDSIQIVECLNFLTKILIDQKHEFECKNYINDLLIILRCDYAQRIQQKLSLIRRWQNCKRLIR